MSVYLANQFSKIEETRQYAKELRKMGITVTSRWLKEKSDPNSSLKDITPEFAQQVATIDYNDIVAANDFVVFTVDPDQPTRRGGRHVETGIAIALGKRVLICGPYENIFHYLPAVIACKNFEQVKEILKH